MGIDDSGADKSESLGGSGGKACDAVAKVLGHSGSARPHYQGSGECRHSYQSLLMPQWQTEDLEGMVADRLWRHRPEDPEDMVANRLWRWHGH